jgi:hypothetical protein
VSNACLAELAVCFCMMFVNFPVTVNYSHELLQLVVHMLQLQPHWVIGIASSPAHM